MKSLRLLLLLPLFCLGVPMPGQTFGEITGEVRDPSGAAVPNAVITAANKGTNAIRAATSNEAGIYSLPSLLPGTYDVKAVKDGFRAITRADIELQVQQTARIDFNMQIGQVTELVEVLGGPDSRQLPDSQSAEEVAEVIVEVIASRQPDVYTRAGAHDRVVDYYRTVAVDP